MARFPRYVLPGQPQHVVQRGNNREPIFAQAADYAFYLEKLKLACEQQACVIHAYVLMTNHVHLLMTPTSQAGMGNVMQGLGRYYVQYFNDVWESIWQLSKLSPEFRGAGSARIGQSKAGQRWEPRFCCRDHR